MGKVPATPAQDLNADPPCPYKKPGVEVHASNPSTGWGGGKDRQLPGAHSPASLAQLVIFWFIGRPCLKI